MKYDALIVLAGGVNEDMSLPEIPKNREDLGIKLFKEGLAPVIIFSGHFTFTMENPSDLSESESMKRYAVSHGVPETAILKDDKSKDTLGNAYFCKVDFVIPKKYKNLAVVTSDFHLDRTKYLFRKVFGDQYNIDYYSTPTVEGEIRKEAEAKFLTLSKQWLEAIPDGNHEMVGHFLFTKHPGYSPNPEMSKEQLLRSLQ